MRFEEAAALRDLLTTVEEIDERQKMAAASGDDADIFGYYAEPPLVAVNLFHLRNGQIVDRREFFWEDQHEFDSARILLVAAAADLSGSAVRARHHPRAGGFRRSRSDGGAAFRKEQPQSRDPHAAARPEEGHAEPRARPTRSTVSTRVSAC